MTQPGRAGARGVIATLGYCGAMVSVTQTVSLPLLPILPDELGTTAGNVSWVATAAVLSGAIANPVMGRLGDMHGKRRMILVSLAVLLAGCVLAATTQRADRARDRARDAGLRDRGAAARHEHRQGHAPARQDQPPASRS